MLQKMTKCDIGGGDLSQRVMSLHQNYIDLKGLIKGDGGYLLRSPKPLLADVKSAVCELVQNRAQIFGLPEGTLYAHEASFRKSCTIKALEVTKLW